MQSDVDKKFLLKRRLGKWIIWNCHSYYIWRWSITLDMPAYILVNFDKYTGPTLINNSIPIIPHSAYWMHNKINHYRKQFPLNLNYATTIDKPQCLTLDRVIIDVGPKEFCCGLSYVAITRVKHLSDFSNHSSISPESKIFIIRK